MINDETLSEDKRVRWRGAYLSCSSEQIEKRLHEATRDGMDIVAQLETIKEAGYEGREDVSGVLEFMNWILSEIVVGLGFEASLGELIAKELTLIDEYPIDEQNERINRLVDDLRNLPVSSTGEAEAPRLGKLLPEKLIYQEDVVEQDIELKVESKDISSRHVTVNNPGVRAKLSYFVLMGNSWKATFLYSIVSSYTKSRFVVLIQYAPNQPWKELPYHFKWIVDEIEAAVSDTGQCRGDKLWVSSKKKSIRKYLIPGNSVSLLFGFFIAIVRIDLVSMRSLTKGILGGGSGVTAHGKTGMSGIGAKRTENYIGNMGVPTSLCPAKIAFGNSGNVICKNT